MTNPENSFIGPLYPSTEQSEKLVESGQMTKIMFGNDPMAYFFLEGEDPHTGIDTYQKIKGLVRMAELRINMIGENPEDLQIIQDGEIAFNQLRTVLPTIDEVHAEYERQLDELNKGWNNS